MPDARLRILVFERQATIKPMAEALGHDVRVCSDLGLRLETVRDFKPHLFIMAGGLMPHDAFDVARQVHAMCKTVIIRVVKAGDIIDSREAFSAGIAFHLVSPATSDELAAICRQVASTLPPA